MGQARSELRGARSYGGQVEHRVLLSHRRPAQGHQGTPALRQGRPASAARPATPQAHVDSVGGTCIRRYGRKGGAQAEAEGFKEGQKITRGSKVFEALHCGSVALSLLRAAWMQTRLMSALDAVDGSSTGT